MILKKQKNGNYSINVNIPKIKKETSATKEINKNIEDTFVNKLREFVKGTQTYTIYNIDFVSYKNDNILSLGIKCTLKEGTTAQRMIIKTYNYDMENDKILKIQDLIKIKNLKEKDVQNKIDDEINNIIKQKNAITAEGYNLYKRTKGDRIYKIENTENFFLGENNYLYIIYSYGNSNFTSEMDTIIF